MRIDATDITTMLIEDLGAKNVRRFYNGWLLYRNRKWEFASIEEITDELKKMGFANVAVR